MVPTEDELMLLLGRIVYEAQETEATLHLALTLISGLSLAQSIEHLKSIYAKKTLGQFLVLVREKFGVKPSFDAFMKDYIDQRNFITHNLSRTSIFSLYTDEGRTKCVDLLTSFRYTNRKVKFSFAALIEMWMRMVSPSHQTDEKFKGFRETEMFQEIEKDFIPQLRAMFGSDEQTKAKNHKAI
jgi:hypothetical protein